MSVASRYHDCTGVRRARTASIARDGDFLDLGATASRDLGEALAEDAGDADDGPVAGLEEVDERHLHPRASGAGDGECDLVRRAEHLSEHRADLVEERDEGWVEVA